MTHLKTVKCLFPFAELLVYHSQVIVARGSEHVVVTQHFLVDLQGVFETHLTLSSVLPIVVEEPLVRRGECFRGTHENIGQTEQRNSGSRDMLKILKTFKWI